MSETTNTSRSLVTGRRLAKTGAWMQLGSLIGLIGTVIGMMRAFDNLEAEATAGISDPSGLSAAIGHVLWTTAAGLGVSFVGVILMCIAALATPYRAKWFYWFLILLLLTPLGIFPFVIALIKRREFFPEKSRGAPSPT